MKRKFLALLCIAAMLVLAFASCDLFNNGEEPDDKPGDVCEHTYSDKWSTNSTDHWHAATCEHAELKSDVANHADEDEDGKCDVCDYEIGHEHTYATTWTSNDTHHWKVATCSHTDQKGELDVHADNDSDGACDTCSAHVHIINLYGKCTVCGEQVTEIDITNINVILPIVLSNTGRVVGGNVSYENVNTDTNKDEDTDALTYEYAKSEKKIVFLLGNKAAYYKVDNTSTYTFGSFTDTQEQWMELLEDGTVFGVYQDTWSDGSKSDIEIDASVNADTVSGYYYSVSTLADAYGAENLLAALYELSQAETASEYVLSYEDGVYTFSFNYLKINSDTADGDGDHVDYFETTVSFTVSESGILTSLNVSCDCYTNSLEDELDNDYTYDQNSGTITMKDTAIADTYVFAIVQNEGARTYVSEHPKSEFIPEYFDAFVDAELSTELGDTCTFVEGGMLNVYFGNFTPSTITSVKYIMSTLNITADEAVIWWGYDGVISIMCNTPGSYPVELSIGGKTFAFTLVVEEYVPDITEQPENSIAVEITGADTYAWSAIGSFTAPEDGDYTFYIPVGYGAWDKAQYDAWAGSPYVDIYDEEGGSFTVSIKAGDTYDFYVSSAERGIVYITYSVSEYTGSGEDQPGGGEVVIGQHPLSVGGKPTQIEGTSAKYIYTAATNGTMTLTVGGAIMADVTYSYTINGGDEIAIDLSSTVVIELLAGDKLAVTVITSGGYSSLGASWIVESTGDDNTLEIGNNTISVTEDDIAAEGKELTFVVTEEGTYSFKSNYLFAMIFDGDGMLVSQGTAYLTAGTYTIRVGVSLVPGAGDYTLTVEYAAPSAEPDGSEDNPYVIESLPAEYTFYSNTSNKVYYLYTATEDGVITITLSVENDSWCDIYAFVDGNADGSDSASSNFETTATFTVLAGKTYRIGLGTFNIAGDTTFSLAFTAGEVGGGEGGEGGEGEDTTISINPDAENYINVTQEQIDAGKINASIIIWEAGEYSFYGNDLYVGSVKTEDGTVIEVNDYGNYELEAWTTYIVEIVTEWCFTPGEYTLHVTYIYPEGHQNNAIWYSLGETVTINYAGNYAPGIWYRFYADCTGTLTITTNVEIANIAIYGSFSSETTGLGTLTFDVVGGRLYYVQIAAFDATEPVDITFSMSITEGEVTKEEGTPNYPNNLVLGDNVASVPAFDGVYFMYVAQANGTINFTTLDPNCSWYYTTNLFDANYETNGDLSVEVYTGDIVYLYVTAADWSATDIAFNASFKAAPTEIWYEGTIDLNGGANEIAIEDNTFVSFQVSGVGSWTLAWDSEDVIVYVNGMPFTNGEVVTSSNPYWGPLVEIRFPEYAAGTLNLTLTPYEAPAAQVVLGENSVLVTDTQNGTAVVFKAPVASTYVFTVGTGAIVVEGYSNYFAGESFELTLAADETVTLIVLSYDYAEGYYDLEVAIKNTESGGDTEGGVTEATLTFVAPAYFEASAEQSVVIAETATYVFTAPGYENISNTWIQLNINGEWTRIDTALPYSVNLNEGTEILVRVFCWDGSDSGKAIVVSMAKEA